MRRVHSTLLAALLFILSASAFTSHSLAQKEQGPAPRTDAERAKVAEMIEKGDTGGAEKLLLQFQPAPAAVNLPGFKYNVQYEEIRACGFYPQETRLECVLDIKRTNGYGGPIGSPGSTEYVYFCVDLRGSGLEPAGMGNVQMHDESAGAQPAWQYAVYRDFNPLGGVRTSNTGNNTTTVTNGPTRKARAILSWYVAPTSCNYVPVWGNVVDFRIRFDPIR